MSSAVQPDVSAVPTQFIASNVTLYISYVIVVCHSCMSSAVQPDISVALSELRQCRQAAVVCAVLYASHMSREQLWRI